MDRTPNFEIPSGHFCQWIADNEDHNIATTDGHKHFPWKRNYIVQIQTRWWKLESIVREEGPALEQTGLCRIYTY